MESKFGENDSHRTESEKQKIGMTRFIGKFAKRGERISVEIPKRLVECVPKESGDLRITIMWDDPLVAMKEITNLPNQKED